MFNTKTGSDNRTFSDGETLTGTDSSGTAGAVVGIRTLPTVVKTGNARVKVQEGVYFINGFFVKNSEHFNIEHLQTFHLIVWVYHYREFIT